MSNDDALKPTIGLLVKLGSLAVHIDELLSAGGHEYDRVAIRSLLSDPDVIEWLKAFNGMGFLPIKR